ncbi:fimbrial protein [Lysobacter soli]|uniref:fimbrial protein n=1 Tax=Lysobacter soli TaxID=453783 RepID=UPI0036CAC4E1
MKKILLVAAAAAGLVSIAPAFAADGTINITGAVTSTTCRINGANSPATINVTLPSVSTAALNAAGRTAGTTPFAIVLSNCSAGINNAVTYFEAGPTIDTATGNLRNTTSGGAANVQVSLLNADATKISLQNAAGSQSSQQVAIANNGATLNYFAQYVANGAAAGAGAVTSNVTFSVVYN